MYLEGFLNLLSAVVLSKLLVAIHEATKIDSINRYLKMCTQYNEYVLLYMYVHAVFCPHWLALVGNNHHSNELTTTHNYLSDNTYMGY